MLHWNWVHYINRRSQQISEVSVLSSSAACPDRETCKTLNEESGVYQYSNHVQAKVVRRKYQNGATRRCRKISVRGFGNTFSLTNRLADSLRAGFCWNHGDKIFCAIKLKLRHKQVCTGVHTCRKRVVKRSLKIIWNWEASVKPAKPTKLKLGTVNTIPEVKTLLQYSNQMNIYI